MAAAHQARAVNVATQYQFLHLTHERRRVLIRFVNREQTLDKQICGDDEHQPDRYHDRTAFYCKFPNGYGLARGVSCLRRGEIGRASCRERVERLEVGVAVKEAD